MRGKHGGAVSVMRKRLSAFQKEDRKLSVRIQVTLPCGGDRRNALAQDDELIFSVPAHLMEDLMAGLRHFDEAGHGYTQLAPAMRVEPPLPPGYVKVGKMIGMDVHD